jgi:hypothetical protein
MSLQQCCRGSTFAIHLLGPAKSCEKHKQTSTYEKLCFEFSGAQAEIFLFFVLGLINSLN